ncbi:MAG TPA: PD-(D/E)XK nuclease family protein [Syntrophales bacterium]|nr:PD-(D/E)XK nuclease family protein [Syntrophales bacterium]HRT62836.1 PD-(D/E)XK nuclease family protein [Syntrophales bacterium]
MASNTLTLTSTGRLARYLRHRNRLGNLAAGHSAWEPPGVMHLNAWLEEHWASSWPETLPAPVLLRLATWRLLSGKAPPPEPLTPDTALYRLLDDNYAVMTRHRLDPATGDAATPLVAWRREISAAFKESLAAKGFFHPAELPARITAELRAGRNSLPEKITLLGFESPAPAEVELFEAIKKRTLLITEEERKRTPGDLKAFRLPTPEQEVLYLLDRIVHDAQTMPLHRIGVVAPDLGEYAPLLESGLRDIAGAPPSENSYFYNLTLGQSLLDFPLIQAGLLPLRFVAEGEKREIFLALLLSPYFGHWKGTRHEIARVDRGWRESSTERGLSELLTAAKRLQPAVHEKILRDGASRFLEFCRQPFGGSRTVESWIAALESLWSALSFPVISDERDRIAWRHLGEILADLRSHLAEVPMDGFEFLSWLRHTFRETPSRQSAPEEAGVQLLGLIESRGLEFDGLYVLGMTDRGLPRPVRPLPLLTGRERMVVLGGTPESQYAFAKRAFSQLMTLAPRVTLLRPEQKNGEILLPSPFWPRQDEERGINIWSDPGRAWIRAAWLKSAFEGLKIGQEMREDPRTPQKPIPRFHPEGGRPGLEPAEGPPGSRPSLPESLSAGEVEVALACPFRFFAERILGIEPLREAGPAVTPLERGKRIHRVLRLFTAELRGKNLDFLAERQRLVSILEACVDTALADLRGKPEWETERRLWLGEKSADPDEPPGILMAWLAAEAARRSEGWNIIGEELRFEKLRGPGWSFEVRGRMDRVDSHDTKGLVVWDYKTGVPPKVKEVLTQFRAPQLPLYLLALRRGHLAPSGVPAEAGGLSAGYIRLKSAGQFKMMPLGPKGFSWKECLDRWEQVIAELGSVLSGNDFPPKPYPVSAPGKEPGCLFCAFVTLCERGVTGELTAAEEEEDEP